MSYAAPIEIVQAALARVGGQQITSLEDNSMPATVAKANYELMARKRLSKHTWSFASYPVLLVYQGEQTVGQMRHAYRVPPEALRVHWVGVGEQRLDDWKLTQGKIVTRIPGDYEALISHRAPESDWPDDFTEAFAVEMEALFIGSLQRNVQEARVRLKDANILFADAMAADKRQAPGPQVIRTGRLASAWLGERGRV
jgi:hypothetical protein